MLEKEELQKQGFEDWSKRDYQQLIKAYEAHGRSAFTEVMMVNLAQCVCSGMPLPN